MHRTILILAATIATAGPAAACPSGAKCIGVGALNSGGAAGLFHAAPAPSQPSKFGIGDVLPSDYTILTNTRYYGLPPAKDGWAYFRVDHRLYRVDLSSREILEDATSEANRAF